MILLGDRVQALAGERPARVVAHISIGEPGPSGILKIHQTAKRMIQDTAMNSTYGIIRAMIVPIPAFLS